MSTHQLRLHYQPPYNWQHMQQFLSQRFIPELEWVDGNTYGRSFTAGQSHGHFNATCLPDEHCFAVAINIDNPQQLPVVEHNIRRILDLDADTSLIEKQLQAYFNGKVPTTGLRLPGTWDLFEAGIRAILGQQISVVAARKLVTQLVQARGERQGDGYLFPTPQAIAARELTELKLPGARKQTLMNLAHYFMQEADPHQPEQWLALKGIGPWTVNYAKMRGLSDPDIYLAGDLGVKKAAERMQQAKDPEQAAPWRSYLTMQLWSMH